MLSTAFFKISIVKKQIFVKKSTKLPFTTFYDMHALAGVTEKRHIHNI